jgi:L-threonylcarbamoyladenylate synthase
MEIISNPSQAEIKRAAQALKDGHLVAFPTETVYGLGADATNEKAVSRVYSVKARPTNHPLIVHISSVKQLGNWARNVPGYAKKLADEFWPGPMTLILKRSELAKNFITGGQENVGLRVPSQPMALALLKEFESYGGFGVAAPSANRFGSVSPTSSNDVIDELGEFFDLEDLILNGGTCSVGIESTIINCLNESPSILRPGAVTHEMITSSLGNKNLNGLRSGNIKVSGDFDKHYSPKAKILLNRYPKKGEGLIALDSIQTPEGVERLLAPSNHEEYAVGLYEALRLGDKLSLPIINIYTPENKDLGVAIIDRIRKSAGQ